VVPADTVLLETEAGLAVSPLSAVRDELLLVNSAIYVTGARGLSAVETLDVVSELDGVPFTVTGYPENPREKLLLIETRGASRRWPDRPGRGAWRRGSSFSPGWTTSPVPGRCTTASPTRRVSTPTSTVSRR